MHLFGIDARADACNELHPHRFPAGLSTHAVEIVHAVKNDRQSSAQRWVPQFAVLIHRRESDAFPDWTTGKRCVSDIADDNARLAIHSLVERGSGGDRTRAAHDRIVGIDPKRSEERMHRPAQPAVESSLARENLAVGSIDKSAEGHLTDRALILPLDGAQHDSIAIRL